MRALWICVTLLILVYNVDTTEAVDWEVGSEYTVLSYTNRAGPFEPSLYVQSQSGANFYFGFTLSDTLIAFPDFTLSRSGERYSSAVGWQLQYHPRGYATSGVFVLGLVSAAFSNAASSSVGGAVGIGVGYQQRLKSNFVFRISTSITAISAQYDSRGSSSPFDIDMLLGRIYTSFGYTFNMSD